MAYSLVCDALWGWVVWGLGVYAGLLLLMDDLDCTGKAEAARGISLCAVSVFVQRPWCEVTIII